MQYSNLRNLCFLFYLLCSALTPETASAQSIPSTAKFVGEDIQTSGSWYTRYGAQGYEIANHSTWPPGQQNIYFSNGSGYTWDDNSFDYRALKKRTANVSGGVASWYGSPYSFNIYVNLDDDQPHQVALYFLDWNYGNRTQKIEVLNGSTLAVIASESIENFHYGIYQLWNVTGRVIFRVSSLNGSYPVVSGVFINTPSPKVSFLGEDVITQGSWQNRYGKQGFSLADAAVQSLPQGLFDLNHQQNYPWTYNWNDSTADVRALAKPLSNPPTRIAAVWHRYGSDAFDIKVSPGDNKPHQVALYCLDWERQNRRQRIQIFDAKNHAPYYSTVPEYDLLDTIEIGDFQEGRYFLWNITGNVIFRVTSLGFMSSAVSGVFLDPVSPDWWVTGYVPVLQFPSAEDNNSPANIGQAKHMARCALDTLHSKGHLRSDQEDRLVDKLVGNRRPINSWDRPTRLTDLEQQKSPLLIGQLKAIARPFYNALNELDPMWVLQQIRLNHTSLNSSVSTAVKNVHYWQNTENPNYILGGYYPWNPNATADQNKTVATIGQLKAIFSLRFENLDSISYAGDDDYLPNNWEIANGLDPTSPDGINGNTGDPDNDGIQNQFEWVLGFDPFSPTTFGISDLTRDRDGDGISDYVELMTGQFNTYGYIFIRGLDWEISEDSIDPDNDGLTTLIELQLGTDPLQGDTDGDGFVDGFEVRYGWDPLINNETDSDPTNNINADPDNDGVTNFNEWLNGINPKKSDSDGDGINDGIEINGGSNPTDPGDGGQAPPPDQMKDLDFKVGGDFANWRMEIKGMGPDDTRSQSVASPTPGDTKEMTLQLRKGNKYEVTMHWIGSIKPIEGAPKPLKWYCWQADVDAKATSQTYVQAPGPPYKAGSRNENLKTFAVGENWVVDNEDGIFTTHLHSLNNNVIDGKKAILMPVDFITPAGDPVSAPVDAGNSSASVPDGANEFTFSPAVSGVMTMKLKAKVSGIGSLPAAEQAKFTFEVDTIGSSTLAWVGEPGGKASVSGDFITATATYTGLPQNNADFGLKKARVKFDGNNVGESKFEVFFPRDEKNHPGGQAGSPNWFFYWLQTVTLLGPNPVVEYAMKGSAYDPNTNKFKLTDGDRLSCNAPYGMNNPLQGIDNFAWTARHESQHYKDWCDYWDVENQGVTKYQVAYGKDGPNDNRDPQTTSRNGSDYLPNNIEDLNLNKAFDGGDRYDWSNGLSNLPGTPAAINSDSEDYTCKRHTTVKGDHSKDWSNPGMQHKTVDKYDD
jgi:Bacterial TSP3 repeat